MRFPGEMQSRRSRIGVGLGSLAALATLPALAVFAAPTSPKAAPAKPTSASARVRFNRDVLPILSDNCFACHGPDRNKRMANLRLDIPGDAVQHGAIVPGKPSQSSLVARVFATDGRKMPPEAAHKALTPAQKNILARWVAQGAQYEQHWSYIPPRRPTVPKLADARYPVRNPIDAFVRTKLREKQILPSPEADRRTLLRRVYLDLTGIPPTPAEVSAFLADKSANAYEKVVDRLLASPHYGERMAIPWLDVVRYADTVGFHGDQNQNAWAYRDYVVRSFNTNKPFDQFTTEQLAGDLLPNPTPEQRTATCFTRLTMMTREGGAQPKEYLAKYTADRVRTVGMAWLGSTLACCECHDHKYDPFTQKDFYSLGAFFADVKQWGVYADYGYTPNPDLKGYNNDYPFPPEIKVESPYLKERMARERSRIVQLGSDTGETLQKDAAARAAYAAWLSGAKAFLAKHPDGWDTPAPEVSFAGATKKRGAKPAPAADAGKEKPLPVYRIEPDDRVVLTDQTPADLELEVQPDTHWVAALRIEALPAAENGNSVFRTGMDAGTVTVSAAIRHEDGKTQVVTFRHAGANFAEPSYRSGFEVVGVQGGWKLSPEHKSEAHVSTWLPATPIHLAPGDTLAVTFPTVQAGCLRVSVSPFVPENADTAIVSTEMRSMIDHADPAESRPAAFAAYLMGSAWNAEAFTQARALEAEIVACRNGITPVMVTEAWKPAVQRVLPRGNWQDESGAIVEPNVPHFLPGYQDKPGQRLTRLDLAKWLVSKENPLTARVFVNRLWRQFFGNGISGLVEDLGTQGEWPTHPELLDWLAVEFRDGAPGQHSTWDVKQIVRLIVTSATYRESSNLRPELHDLDPNNRLLASQNPRRLEAELVRDNALKIAGLLCEDVGGPPVHPYQPEGYYASIQFPDRTYVPERDERQWRRGVYMHWQRTFLHPALLAFDASSREDCIAARTVANTPQQALTLLNDPEYVEAARAFAAELLSTSARGDGERLEAAFQRALCRSPKPKERASLLAFLGKVRRNFRSQPEDARKLLAIGFAPVPDRTEPVELASWATVCRVILNLNETITRY